MRNLFIKPLTLTLSTAASSLIFRISSRYRTWQQLKISKS